MNIDKDVAAERYEMLLNHALLHDGAGAVATFLMSEDPEFYLFEVACEMCDWWDHWDERKEPEVEFTEKNPAIISLMTAIAGSPREEGHCVFERKYPGQEHSLEFRTPLDRKEYSISGMCQTCQDVAFDIPRE